MRRAGPVRARLQALHAARWPRTLPANGAPKGSTCRKGLRDRNSPTCTLSQNGYGACPFARRDIGAVVEGRATPTAAATRMFDEMRYHGRSLRATVRPQTAAAPQKPATRADVFAACDLRTRLFSRDGIGTPQDTRKTRQLLELNKRCHLENLTAVGFEPTQLALVELESTPLDHLGKLS